MKIVVDDKIPYISQAVESIADKVVYAPGKDFTNEMIKDADAIIVRTRTKCNRKLLEGTNVRFIATATIGFDHIDTAYCREAGIEWANCPGCNAGGVEQYVQSVLILLSGRHGRNLNEMTMGVVGVGNVGSRVADMARRMGLRVLLCDPPRQEAEGGDAFCPFETVVAEADIITFHVPLTMEGKYRTFHYADEPFFERIKDGCWIINTSRGEVVDTKAIKVALNSGKIADAVIDVWEGEPDIDMELLEKAFIATPHIAGYSADGKANASRMSMDNICRFFGLEANYEINAPEPGEPDIVAASEYDALLRIYNPMEDCKRLRERPADFEKLRGDYPVRRERSAYNIIING